MIASGIHMVVSINGGTPKSSISRWDFLPYKPTILGYPQFMETPIYSFFKLSSKAMLDWSAHDSMLGGEI